MRSLVFDELRKDEIEKIKSYLDQRVIKGPIEGLYWLEIPKCKLTKEQISLLPQVNKFKIAIEIEVNLIKFELLVRSEGLDNTGGGMASNLQMIFIAKFGEDMSKTLGLITC